jgi:hypothetical protein
MSVASEKLKRRIATGSLMLASEHSLAVLQSTDCVAISILLAQIVAELEGETTIEEIDPSILRAAVPLGRSPSGDVRDAALDLISYIAMADDHVLRSLCYLQAHQVLFDIVGSDRLARRVCCALELLGEMVDDKPSFCMAVDGDNFIEAPCFVLRLLADANSCFLSQREEEDHSEHAHLIGASFDLLAKALSVFSAPPQLLSDVQSMAMAFWNRPNEINKYVVIHAIYSLSYAQSRLSLTLFGGMLPVVLENLGDRNQTFIGYALGLFNNWVQEDFTVGYVFLRSNAFFTIVPSKQWNNETTANFIRLHNSLLQLVPQCPESIPFYREIAGPLKFLCLEIAELSDFRNKIDSVCLLCALIQTADAEIIGILLETKDVLMAILDLLVCEDPSVVISCVPSLLTLCQMAPIAGTIDVLAILHETETLDLLSRLSELILPPKTLAVFSALSTYRHETNGIGAALIF